MPRALFMKVMKWAHRHKWFPASDRYGGQGYGLELTDNQIVDLVIGQGPSLLQGQCSHAAASARIVALGRQLKLNPKWSVRCLAETYPLPAGPDEIKEAWIFDRVLSLKRLGRPAAKVKVPSVIASL